MYSSSTSLSAKSRNVHRACPAGGSPQQSAIRWASPLPSSLRGRWPPVRRWFSAASSPSVTYRLRIRWAVGSLTSRASVMARSLQPGPSEDSSALSRIRAWVSFRAGACPVAINPRSWARSVSVNMTRHVLFRMPLRMPSSASQIRQLNRRNHTNSAQCLSHCL